MSRTAVLYAVMAVLGLCWGFTQPAAKIALDGGITPLGIIAWQTVYMSVFLTGLLLARGGLPAFARHWRIFVVIALTGTLIPNSFSYRATEELPAGVMSIIIALVPMFALPLALATGLERWRPDRLAGVCLGALAVVLIAAPETSLPAGTEVAFVLVALVAPFFYAVEGTYLARQGTGGLDALQVLWGASLVATAVAVPLTVATGQWVDPFVAWDTPRWAVFAASVAHGIAYAGYIWLVGAAGAVFAAQVAYLVTGAGVLWSMALLGERYSPWVWAAFALMLAGVALVQPRARRTAEEA